MKIKLFPILIVLLVASASTLAQAQDFTISKEEINIGKKQYSPYLYQSYPNVITSYSIHYTKLYEIVNWPRYRD